MKMNNQNERDEKQFFEHLVDKIIKKEAMDILIAERLKYLNRNFEFEPSLSYEQIYPHEDNAIDYESYEPIPEDYGQIPVEIPYGEKYELLQMDFIEEVDYSDRYNGIFEEESFDCDEKEEYFDDLIQEYLKYEKEFLDDPVSEIIVDDSYFEKAFEEWIFEEFERNYEPELYDYEEYDEPWRDWEFEDESVKDPFDDLGGIDYPEGWDDIEHDFYEPLRGYCEEESYEPSYDVEYEIYCMEEEPEEPDYAEMYNNLVEEGFLDYNVEEEPLNHEKDEHLNDLIQEYLKYEKEFLDDPVCDIIVDDSYYENAYYEMLIEEFERDYEPYLYDYEEYDEPWRDWEFEDESVKDPFDDLGDMDYPEIENYDEIIENDFEAFERQKSKKANGGG